MNFSEKCLETVTLLNEQIQEEDDSFPFLFAYVSSGWHHMIKFNDQILWSSEDDGYDLEEKYKGDLTKQVKALFKFYIKELNKVRRILLL